ncbi:MAG: homoserine O-succinyltransferase [Pseudomonadota bacterium]
MPLVAHNDLPAFARLRAEGCDVLDADSAERQDIRALHVGLLNMMPDAAMEATERQFLRLIDRANRVVQITIHFFTVDALPRGDRATDHIAKYYDSFDAVRQHGLDALILTGANVTQPALEREAFWPELAEVTDWAAENVTSTLCSCLASHAVWQHRFGIRRQNLQRKCWGVFEHRAVDQHHPLAHNINTRFAVPHSRFNDVSRVALEKVGVRVLTESDEAGVLTAVSPDGFRFVFMQGHPEYDTNSLLKEYKRELTRFAQGELDAPPPFVRHFFDARCKAILVEYAERVRLARARNATTPAFPEHLIEPALDNVWRDTAKAMVSTWIGKVYQLTNVDPRKPFQAGVDPDNPLDLPR